MMTAYSTEQLNYFRIGTAATDIISECLRTIFKQEWDHRYKATLGEWNDTAQNGQDFYNKESPRKKARNARLLTTMQNGNTTEWDGTMLFYAILHSDCIDRLNPTVQTSVDDLRRFRNDFAHMPQGKRTDLEFQTELNKVDVAFRALGLPTRDIQAISKQTSFPTEELVKITKKVADLVSEVAKLEQELHTKEEERLVLEDQLQQQAPSFCVLPPGPAHDVYNRETEVSEMKQQLHKLKETNEACLTAMYISGNPGSGKSQLARQVGKEWYKEVTKDADAAAFIMTLNGESLDTILESYITFARQVKCPEYAVTNIISSSGSKTKDKVLNLKSLITSKLHLYTSWLLIVDNVINLRLPHLPHLGSEEWKSGQLLFTTQDISCIPPSNSFVTHVCTSKGMLPTDATRLLSFISGINHREMEGTVARELDYQPLALASAATFVKKLRESKISPDFSWSNYLQKLEEGKRQLTEEILSKANPSYPKSMTAAVTMAVERAAHADGILTHTFRFLSLCSREPVRIDVITNYICDKDEDQDSEAIAMTLRACSLFLFEDQENIISIRLHQIVHDVMKTVNDKATDIDHEPLVYNVVLSFDKFVSNNLPDNWEDNDFIIGSKSLVPHLTILNMEVSQLSFKEYCFTYSTPGLINSFRMFARILKHHCHFKTALGFLDVIFNNFSGLKEVQLSQVLSDAGDVQYELGNFIQAKIHHEHALAIRKEELGCKHIDVGRTLDKLGLVHHALGELTTALQYHENALTIIRTELGNEHVDLACTYDNLGDVQFSIGNPQLAQRYFEDALTVRYKRLGHDDVKVAQSLDNMGVAHYYAGDLEQAKQYQERALAIRLKQLGSEHVDVSTSHNNLGAIDRDLGDLQQAKRQLERALAINLKQLGPEHVRVAHNFDNLGTVYRALGNLQQAKQHHERALAIRLKQLAPEHLGVANNYSNLAQVYLDLGELQQAKRHTERALAIRLKLVQPEHIDVATSYSDLGALYYELGDMQQAKQHQERALAIRLKRLGSEHSNVALSYNHLGVVCYALGDLQQAKQHHERSLAIRIKRLGPNHVDVATTYNHLGVVCYALGDLQQAKQHHERALDIRLKRLGSDHAEVVLSYRHLCELQQAEEHPSSKI